MRVVEMATAGVLSRYKGKEEIEESRTYIT
jgi:hypothetical protein